MGWSVLASGAQLEEGWLSIVRCTALPHTFRFFKNENPESSLAVVVDNSASRCPDKPN